MDDIFSIMFFIWVLFSLFEGLVSNKKRNTPTIQNGPDDSELPSEQIEIIDLNNLYKPESAPKSEVIKVKEQPKDLENPEPANFNFTSKDVVDAFIFAEIFGKPKALRRR